jgi:hypothetical protein
MNNKNLLKQFLHGSSVDTCKWFLISSSCINLVPRACDPREGMRGSGLIRCRKPGILAKIELRIPFQRPIRFLPETDYPRASRSFPGIAGSGNEIAPAWVVCWHMQVVLNKQFLHGSSVDTCKWFLIKNDNSVKLLKKAGKRQRYYDIYQ